MKLPVLKGFDGSDRLPRIEQRHVIRWLQDNWDQQYFALNGPCGVGKKALARMLQKQYKTQHGAEAKIIPK